MLYFEFIRSFHQVSGYHVYSKYIFQVVYISIDWVFLVVYQYSCKYTDRSLEV